jgi:hypothetical protein
MNINNTLLKTQIYNLTNDTFMEHENIYEMQLWWIFELF